MPINYNIWGQHTIAEARYNGREMGIHVRIPARVVMETRDNFSAEDLAQFNPHIDLTKQLYQFHIFNGTGSDAYIDDIPFESIKQLLWYLHRNLQQRNSLLLRKDITRFQDFVSKHKLPKKHGIVRLYVGHEKYGLFDLVQEDRFIHVQLHRAALYGAFLSELNYVFEDKDIEDALPEEMKEQVENGMSLREAIERSMDLRSDGEFTFHSVLEALTLIIDEESPRLKKGKLKVCKNHDPYIYWTDYKGRRIYRRVDPRHSGAGKIRQELENIVEQECPICEEVSLVH